MSAAFADAASSASGLDQVAFALATNEKRQAKDYLDTLQQQLGAYDELAARVNQLKGTYTTLGEAQLQQIARTEQQLEQARKRAQEERDAVRRQQQELKADSNTDTGSGGVSRVEIVHKVEGNGQLSEQQLQALMRSSGFESTVSNIVMRALQRSRTLSGG